tara:strand:- start:2229 stop:2777 length:549 start_codon:yes stop_codon:yes gene_type:complete
MRKLTQKELVKEGVGNFMKNVAKGASVVGGRALKGLAKAASPTAYGLAQKIGKSWKDTNRAVIAATSSPEDRIKKHFKDLSYEVISINPGVSKDTRVVKVAEIVYKDNDKGVTQQSVPIDSPYVVKVDKSGIKILRGPRRVPRGNDSERYRNADSTPGSPSSVQESQKSLLKHLHSGSQTNK